MIRPEDVCADLEHPDDVIKIMERTPEYHIQPEFTAVSLCISSGTISEDVINAIVGKYKSEGGWKYVEVERLRNRIYFNLSTLPEDECNRIYDERYNQK